MFIYKNFFASYVDNLHKNNIFRNFYPIKRSRDKYPYVSVLCQGQWYDNIVFSSNDYLALSLHKGIVDAGCISARKYGSGTCGTRNITGTTSLHNELEDILSVFHNKDKAILFNSAYSANVTLMSALGTIMKNECVFFSDSKNHASIIDGIRLSRCEKNIFHHNDMNHLEEQLKKYHVSIPKIIVFESVYSITGSISPIKDIIALASKYNAMTIIDDVHGIGLYGDNGSGLSFYFDDIDIIVGTLGKSIGCSGGYISSYSDIIQSIRTVGSGFIFTTSLSPFILASSIRAITLIQEEEGRLLRTEHHNVVSLLRKALKRKKIHFYPNTSHITSIPLHKKSRDACMEYSICYLGMYIQYIDYPTVAKGEECLRITLSPLHSDVHINYLVDHIDLLIKS